MEWQNQYSLSQGIIPQDMRSLLDTLELIEKGENDKKPRAIVSTENKKSEDKKGGTSKKDSKRSSSFREERAPKRARTEKLCDLCKSTEELILPTIRWIVRSSMPVVASNRVPTKEEV
jgi:hypothetical protein